MGLHVWAPVVLRCFSFKSAVLGGTSHTHALAPPPYPTSQLISTATLRSRNGPSLGAFLIVFVQSGCWSAFVTAPPTRPKSQTDALAPLVSPPFYLVFSRPTDTSRHVAVCAPDLHSEAPHLLLGLAPHVRCGTPPLLHCRFCTNVLRCGIIIFSAHTNVCVQPLTQFHLP